MSKNDINENELLKTAPEILNTLLIDRTTNQNIIWATKSYENRGVGFQETDNIKLHSITGLNSAVIQPRSEKSHSVKKERTKVRAEVFTPTWIVDKQVQEVDQQYQSLSLDEYVNKTWLEITCGEAPYIVTRYDAVSGDTLVIDERVGFLDRKLQRINQEVDDEETWFKCVVKAYQATYGYEFQGDSLLLARENLLATFNDYYQDKFNKQAGISDQLKIAEIVSYNLVQMDGLKYTVPYAYKPAKEMVQLDLFAEPIANEDDKKQSYLTQIKNWQSDKIIDFKKLTIGVENMKFDVVIGNPPYQEKTNGKETKNGQKRVKSIFQFFQEQGDQITNELTCLIYPGGRWIHQAGKGMKKFGLNQINDPHLEKLLYYPNANEIFNGVGIADGISIVIKNKHKETTGFKYEYFKNGENNSMFVQNPGDQLMPLNPDDNELMKKISKFVNNNKVGYLNNKVLSQKLFGIESSFVEDNPNKIYPYSDEFDSSKYIKLFANDKSGKSGRTTWFLADKDILKKGINYLNEWQVVVSSANAGGQKRDNQLSIMDNHTAFGRSRVALSSFKTRKEATNFKKYVSSYIIRYTFLMTDESLTSLAKWVPDIGDYSDGNKIINFDNNIDDQLCNLIGFDKEEFSYIVDKVNNVRNDK